LSRKCNNIILKANETPTLIINEFYNVELFAKKCIKGDFMIKKSIFSLVLILMLAASLNILITSAQTTGTIIVIDVAGGSTDVVGTTTYADGTEVTITAMPDNDYVLSTWVVTPNDGSGDMVFSDNPLIFTVAGDITYTVTPNFVIPQAIPGRTAPSDLSNAAIVVILASAGGTTNPAPGTYALANAANFDLKATPNSGWQFSHWTIYGVDTGHGSAPANWNPTNNPYNVNHGYGATYSYQAVFTPIGSTEPTPTPTPTGTVAGMSNETWIMIALAVIIVVLLVVLAVVLMKKK
jgi:hypothetical protein